MMCDCAFSVLRHYTERRRIKGVALRLVEDDEHGRVLANTMRRLNEVILVRGDYSRKMARAIADNCRTVVRRRPALIHRRQCQAYPCLNALPNAFKREHEDRRVTIFTPRFRIETRTGMSITGEDVSTVTKATRRHVFTVRLLERRRAITIRERRDVLTLRRLLRVRDVTSTSNKTMMTITPHGPMTILGPYRTQVMFVFKLCRIHVPNLRLS